MQNMQIEALAKKMTDSELENAIEHIDGILAEVLVLKAGTGISRIEARLAQGLIKDWKGEARKAVEEGLRILREREASRITEAELRTMLSAFDTRLSGFGEMERARIERAVMGIYDLSRKDSARRAEVKPHFNLMDKKAKEVVSEDQVYWVGRYYSDQLSEKVRKVAEEIAINQGLGRKEAGDALEKAIRSEFGIAEPGRPPVMPEVEVPSGFKGGPQAYFEGIASIVNNRSRTFGNLESFVEAGVTRYTIMNPLDERTCKFCRFMNGKSFQVEHGVRLRERILKARSPEEVKEVAGWKTIDEAMEMLRIRDEETTLSEAHLERLAQAGLNLPPHHLSCRCTVEIG